MRRGFDGLAGLVQTALSANPYSGHVFAFRGKRGDLIKILWWDGQGLCLLAKRLERGRFVWPQAESGSVALTPAQSAPVQPSPSGNAVWVIIRESVSNVFAHGGCFAHA